MDTEKKKPEGKPRKIPRVVTALGDALARWRESRGLSMIAAATEVGVRARTWTGWESDGRAPAADARALLRAHVPGLARILRALPTTWSRVRGVTRRARG